MKNTYKLLLLLFIIIMCSYFIIKECFTTNDIIVFDEKKTEMYNIADKMCVPRFSGDNEYICNHDYNALLREFPNTILSIYINSLEENEKHKFNIVKIQKAVDLYIEQNKEKIVFIDEINKNDTLFVHVRSGDFGEIEDEYIKAVKQISLKYNKVYLLCGIHSNDFNNVEKYKNVLVSSINKIIEGNDKFTVNLNEPDIHLCIFRKCKNLLLHRGGFSNLGQILFTGDNLYLTKRYNFGIEEYTKLLNNKYTIIE